MKKIKLIPAIFLASMIASCSKNNSPVKPITPGNTKDVYVVGWQTSADGNHSLAKLWKNGVASTLNEVTSVADAVANSIYVNGNDVYLTFNENGIPKLWKNGTATALSDGSKQVSISSVFVNGTDVYVAGEEGNVYYSFFKLWKNGVASTIATGIQTSPLTDKAIVCASGNDVYVLLQGQFETPNPSIRLWKNGAFTSPITPSSQFVSALASSIFVSGTAVYVGGYQRGGGKNDQMVATIWKAGVATTLTDGSADAVVNSVYVSGNDVYAAGWERNNTNNYAMATIWKNGVATPLTNGNTPANAYSVFVSGNDVYVAGAEATGGSYAGSIAKIWKNGIATALADNTKTGEALAIFVK